VKKVTKREARKVIKDLVNLLNNCIVNKLDYNATAVRDIITFLRGPDNCDHLLKWNTTAKVRGLIGLTASSALDINSSNVELEQYLTKQEMREEWPVHHQSHYHAAYRALKHLGYLK